MRCWVDGYNLLCHLKLDRNHEREQARARVLGLLSGRCERVWFDGKSASREHRAGIEVHFTAGESADDAIVEALRAAGGAGITVITNDAELQQRCRQLGSAVQSCAEFLNEQTHGTRAHKSRNGGSADPQRPTTVRTRAEMDEWLRLFSEPRDQDPDQRPL